MRGGPFERIFFRSGKIQKAGKKKVFEKKLKKNSKLFFGPGGNLEVLWPPPRGGFLQKKVCFFLRFFLFLANLVFFFFLKNLVYSQISNFFGGPKVRGAGKKLMLGLFYGEDFFFPFFGAFLGRALVFLVWVFFFPGKFWEGPPVFCRGFSGFFWGFFGRF